MPTLPSETPGWIVLAVAAAVGLKYLAQFLSEASESFAKVFGPLGRRWRARGEQRMQERADTDTRRVSAITEDRDFFEKRSIEVEKRAVKAENDNKVFMDWYLQCDQRFHRNVVISAAEKGCPLPEWKPLSEWIADAESRV